ncbi:MAG: hypothetical protein ACXWVG_12015 [Telluria sp.]
MNRLLCGIFLFIMKITAAASEVSPGAVDETCRKQSKTLPGLSEWICHNAVLYKLQFLRQRGQIVVTGSGTRSILHEIPHGYDPTLVGSEKFIKFLPKTLQVYKAHNIFLYLSTVRTNGGTGAGQCGSGTEIYLNFLEINSTHPNLRSSILIGSCRRSIELLDQDLSAGEIGAITSHRGRLHLQFVNYMNMDGYPKWTVSRDLKKLILESNH